MTQPAQSALSEAVLAKRKAEGLNLRQAAVSSGIAFSTLSRIERGKECSVRVDRQVRAWLNGDTPQMPAPPMTLRDWFASRAPEPPATWWGGGGVTCAGYAMWNYQFADAMMAERAKALGAQVQS